MNYVIVTSESVLDGNELNTVEDERAEDERRELLIKEQDNILKENGYDILNTAYKIHFFNSAFHDDEYRLETIYDAIELLAIKEGADLVQYDNGNYGYVAYYGAEKNGFEIMEPTTEEIFRHDEGDYAWANEQLTQSTLYEIAERRVDTVTTNANVNAKGGINMDFKKVKKLVGTIIVTRKGKKYFVAKSKDKRIYAMNLNGEGFFYIDNDVYDGNGDYIGNNNRDIVKIYKTNGGHSFGGFAEDMTDENVIFSR